MSLLKGIERFGRRKFSKAIRFALLGRAGTPLHSDDFTPESILVVRIDNRMGNLVLLTSLLQSLGERFPSANITLLVSSSFAAVIQDRGWNVIQMDKKGQISNPLKLRKLLNTVKDVGADTVIDASHPHGFSLSTAMFCGLTGIHRRIGSPAPGGEGWYTHVPDPSSWPGKAGHESKALQSLGRIWPDWPEWRRPSLPVKPMEKKDLIGFHAGGKPGRAFSLDRLRELTHHAARILPVVVFWGSEGERSRAEAVAGENVFASRRTPLESLPEELSALRAFVTPDTGPMHLASAVGVPVTAVFSVDNACRFKPLSDGSQTLLNPSDEEVINSLRRSLQASP